MRNVASGSDVVNGTSKQSASVQDYEQPRYSQRDTILTMAGVLMVMLPPWYSLTFWQCQCCLINVSTKPL